MQDERENVTILQYVRGSGPGSPALQPLQDSLRGPASFYLGLDEKRGELDQASIRGTLFLGLAIYHQPGTLNVQWRLQAESETVYEFVEICDYFPHRFLPSFLSFSALLAAKKKKGHMHLCNYTITAQMSTSMGDMTRTQIFTITEDGLENKDTWYCNNKDNSYIEQK